MRLPRVLLALALVGGMTYATNAVAAGAAETAPRAIPVADATAASRTATVEVFSPDGTIRRVPVRRGSALQSPATASTAGGAAALSAPLTRAEAASGTADGTVTTVQNSGPSDKRFDIVFVGDGYRAAEQSLFRQQAAAQWTSITQREPFKSLKSSFNVWLVDVVSAESGADHETQGVLRNTALGATFFCNNTERLLCANGAKAEQLARKAPGADQVAILVNTQKYGGAGGRVATVAGGNREASEILIHELGHSMGGLADEYTFPGTFSGGEPTEPNASLLTAAQMRTSGAKWAQHLGKPAASGGTVDTFEGAKYADKGIYRPSQDSIMRTLGHEFDPVGIAAMRAAILAKVS